MTRISFLCVYLLAGIATNAFGTGFDCKKAAAPVEKAICQNPELSLADDVLTESYQFLVSSCQALTGTEDLKALQKNWLTEVRTQFTPDESGFESLKKKYRDRNATLTKRLSQCSLQRGIGGRLTVKTLSESSLAYSLPYVVAASPEIGRQINDAVFTRLLEKPAPGKFRDGLSGVEETYGPSGNRTLMSASYSVVRNDGRLLVLELEGESCYKRCRTFKEQMLFDARTGRSVESADLFTDIGADTLAKQLRYNRIAHGKSIVAKARRNKTLEENERSTYLYCLKEWAEYEPRLWSMAVDNKGQWRFIAGNCSTDYTNPHNLLDDLDEAMTLAQLGPYLSAYGRSLLQGVGDVRDPAVTAIQCAKPGDPLPKMAQASTGSVVSIVAGEEHQLLLQKSGRLWAWGRNSYGQVGSGDPSSSSNAFLEPRVVGEDFVKVAAGNDASVGIRRDGSLWAWGLNYMEAAHTSLRHPIAIGKNIVSVVLEERRGLALQDDGKLWAWGDDLVGKTQLSTDVIQMIYGPYAQTIALKRDGSIWRWGGRIPNGGALDALSAHKVGEGYTRLAGHNIKAAYMADGSLWAWDETLAGFTDTRGDETQGPSEVGRDFVNVAVLRYNFVFALKSDGSLWATHERGLRTGLEPIACGYKDIAVDPHGPLLLALNEEGDLVGWADWRSSKNWRAQRNMFMEKPITLGREFVKLYQVDGVWGSGEGGVFALKADGSIWRLHTEGNSLLQAKDILQKVPFPGVID